MHWYGKKFYSAVGWVWWYPEKAAATLSVYTANNYVMCMALPLWELEELFCAVDEIRAEEAEKING